MTDRKLLELAAKAADIRVGPHPSAGGALWDESDPQNHKLWNPLEDDGDALRLAVKLRLSPEVKFSHGNPKPWLRVVHRLYVDGTSCVREDWEHVFSDEYVQDPYAATRRAIVRAAAAIGEAAHG